MAQLATVFVTKGKTVPGPAGLYPQRQPWQTGRSYRARTVLLHEGDIWISERLTDQEPGHPPQNTAPDWSKWVDVAAAVSSATEQATEQAGIFVGQAQAARDQADNRAGVAVNAATAAVASKDETAGFAAAAAAIKGQVDTALDQAETAIAAGSAYHVSWADFQADTTSLRADLDIDDPDDPHYPDNGSYRRAIPKNAGTPWVIASPYTMSGLAARQATFDSSVIDLKARVPKFEIFDGVGVPVVRSGSVVPVGLDRFSRLEAFGGLGGATQEGVRKVVNERVRQIELFSTSVPLSTGQGQVTTGLDSQGRFEALNGFGEASQAAINAIFGTRVRTIEVFRGAPAIIGLDQVLLGYDDDGRIDIPNGLTPETLEIIAEQLDPAPTSAFYAPLTAWHANTSRIRAGVAGATAKLLVGGDSWAEWRDICGVPLSQRLWEEFGQGGTGWIGLKADENALQSQLVGDARLVKAGLWTLRDMDPALSRGIDGYAAQTTDPTATIVMTNIRGNRIRWPYLNGSSPFQYSLDGAPPVSVGGGNTGSIATLDLNNLVGDTHNLTISHGNLTGMVTHYGGYATLTAGGVELSKAGNGGSFGAQWAAMAPVLGTTAALVAPDVVADILATNDARLGLSANDYEAGRRARIALFRAANPYVGFVLVLPPESGQAVGSPLFAEYRERLEKISSDTPGVRIVDLYRSWGSYAQTSALGLWDNNIHPNLSGGHLIAQAILDVLKPV